MRSAAFLGVLLSLFLTSNYAAQVDENRIKTGLASITPADTMKKVSKLAADAWEGRNSGYAGCRKAGDWIGEQFKDLGLKAIGDNSTYFQTFTFAARGQQPLPKPGDPKSKKPRKKSKKKKKSKKPVEKPLYSTPTTRNVVALLEGSDPAVKEEVVIVGAHYDHVGKEGQWNAGSRRGRPKGKDDIWNGADDNASGTALVMEAAEAFMKSGVRPRRSILFICFSAEEHGLHGSNWYCDHPLIPLDKTVAMINLDMVGYKMKKPMEVAGVDHASGGVIRKAVTKAMKRVKAFKGRLRPWAASGSSDHAPFIKKSIPSAYFLNGLNNDYHTIKDEVSVVSGPRMANACKVLFLTLIDLANLPEKPTFVKGQTQSSSEGVLGIQIAGSLKTDEVKKLRLKRKQGGLKVDNVYPMSVASKAGVLPGDIIIRLGKEDLKRGRERATLRQGLRKVKPGQRFTIKVVRGKSRKNLRAAMPK